MKNLLLITLLLPLQLMAQEKPFGKYISDVKTFNYGNWKVKENDTITMKSGEKAFVKRILKYSQDEIEDYVFYTKLKIGEKTDTYNFDMEIESGNIVMPEGVEKSTVNPGKQGDSYSASNGKTYYVGDVIKLGRGSGLDGHFIYLTMSGWGALMSYDRNQSSSQFNIDRGYAGLAVNIKKIRTFKFKGAKKTIFVVGGGNITNYSLDIEQAIATCEIEDCTPKINGQIIQQTSSADEIVKFKKLMDEGIITKEEFEMKKQQLLAR